jgi:hypothetical protein
MNIICRTVVGAFILGLTASLLTGAFAQGTAAKEHHSASKPIVSAAPVQAGAARTPDAVPGVTEREGPCSA